MKRVCQMTCVHTRNDTRILKMCKSLARAGYEVVFLCADNKPDEVLNEIRVVSAEFHPRNRLERIWSSGAVMIKAALEIDADIYHFHDPELLPVGTGLKARGKRVIYDSHEDYPVNIMAKRWIPKLLRPIIRKAFSDYERHASRLVDAVISVNPQIARRFDAINKRSRLIPNFPSINDCLLGRKRRNTPFTERARAICYAGLIASERMHHVIIRAMQLTPGVVYLLAGPGDDAYLQELESLPMWKNVRYHGCLSHDRVWDLYGQASAGVVILDYSPVYYGREGTLGVTKLFEFMCAGLPVICTDFVSYREVVEGNRCGICVNPYDIEEIAAAINFIMSNPREAEQMGANGKRAVEQKYNWEAHEATLVDLYAEIVEAEC